MSNFIDDKTIFILDSYGLIFREFYAFFSRPLTNSKGQNVSAVFGFFRNLSVLFKNFNPKYFIAAMDSRTPTFRHEQFKEYKATRAKTPDELKAQFPMIEECLNVLGVPVVRVDGFEADDIIATIAKKCDEANRHCVILSGDKDLQQLANDNIHMLKPDKIKVWLEADANDISNEWGVEPKKILDLLSLMGDSADNVPGVQGCGPKTAVKLIQEYGSLEGIYQNADQIKGSIGEKIRADKENAFLSKQLITLRQDVPLDCGNNFSLFDISHLKYEDFADEMIKRELPALARTYNTFIGKKSTSSNKKSDSASDDAQMSLFETEPKISMPAKNFIGEEEIAPEVVQNQGDYKACLNIEELKQFIDCAIKAQTIAFDSETDSLNTRIANLVGFSLSYEKGKGIYVPLILNGDALFAPPTIGKKDALEQLKRIFYSDCTIVMHNAKFDLEVLAYNGLDVLDSACKYTLEDTMIAAWLLNPDKLGKSPYSLETLSEQKLGLKGIEFAQLVSKDQTFADVNIDDASKYGSEDADFTLQLWNKLKVELEKANLMGLYKNLEMKVLPILTQMELTGIHIDPKNLASYAQELKTQIAKCEKEIYQEAGHEFNIASPKQLSTVLFVERHLKPGKKTKTGYSTDTDVLESLKEFDVLPGMILDYRAKAKLLSTYVETLPQMADEQNRIHTTFMQTGTATGRLSSKDPNLQNIPVRSEEGRKIRSSFTSPEGKVLISADYAQIELVVLAHLSLDKNLCQAFNDGIDVHKSTASIIYGVPMDSVTSEMRRNAKTLNFGLMYGMSAFSLAKDLNISRTKAQEFIANYFMFYSGVREFFDKNISQAQTTGYIETINGRRRYIPNINSTNHIEKEAAIRIAKNSPIQGSAADIVKQAMINVSEALKKTPTGAKMLLQVHDELILECPDDEKSINDTIALITTQMENAVKLNVPLKVSVESGKAWGEFH